MQMVRMREDRLQNGEIGSGPHRQSFHQRMCKGKYVGCSRHADVIKMPLANGGESSGLCPSSSHEDLSPWYFLVTSTSTALPQFAQLNDHPYYSNYYKCICSVCEHFVNHHHLEKNMKNV